MSVAVDALRDLFGERGGRHPDARAFAARLGAGPVVTADWPGAGIDPDVLRALARRLAPALDAVVLRPPRETDAAFSPSYATVLLREAGLRVITSLDCRDRNRVAIEGELAALADIGADAVLAVADTAGSRTSAAVFDLDVAEVVALSARAGHVTIVAGTLDDEVGALVDRLAAHVESGADAVVLEVADDPAAVADVVAGLRERGAAVPVLAALTGPAGADVPALARRLLAVDGVAGIHLTATAEIDDPEGAARDTAQLAAGIVGALR